MASVRNMDEHLSGLALEAERKDPDDYPWAWSLWVARGDGTWDYLGGNPFGETEPGSDPWLVLPEGAVMHEGEDGVAYAACLERYRPGKDDGNDWTLVDRRWL